MACPKCNCKLTYHYDDAWDGDPCDDEIYEKCAACGHIFDIECAAEDADDDLPEM